MRMKESVAVVTGAGHPRGMGRAIALAMAREGANLVLADINEAGAAAIAEEIRALDQRALAVRTDVSREEQVKEMVDSTLREFGHIDVLVNNAGFGQHRPVVELTVEEWDRMLDVHLKGTFLCTKAVLPSMMRQKRGSIVYISSVTAERGGGPWSGIHYSSAKAGIMGFAKTVARQYASYGVRSNVVVPGYIDTDITRDFETPERRAERLESVRTQVPLGRLGTPQDVAEAVLFLASDSAAYITGEVLDVNGGYHID